MVGKDGAKDGTTFTTLTQHAKKHGGSKDTRKLSHGDCF